MAGYENEKLREAFEKFLSAEDAARAASEVEKGEELLRRFSAAGPGDEVLERVKARVNAALKERQLRTLRYVVLKVAAAAAVLFLVVTAAIFVFNRPGDPRNTTGATQIVDVGWDANDITVADESIATLTAEAQQIEKELWALQFGEDEGNGEIMLYELELELMEESGGFWKG
jgi:hypothetical protein